MLREQINLSDVFSLGTTSPFIQCWLCITWPYLCWFFPLPHGAEWAPSITSCSPGSRAATRASWPGQSGGNLSVCVTHGALFSQHGSAVYAPDILPVNDLVSSD